MQGGYGCWPCEGVNIVIIIIPIILSYLFTIWILRLARSLNTIDNDYRQLYGDETEINPLIVKNNNNNNSNRTLTSAHNHDFYKKTIDSEFSGIAGGNMGGGIRKDTLASKFKKKQLYYGYKVPDTEKDLWFWNPFLFKSVSYFAQNIATFLDRGLLFIFSPILSVFNIRVDRASSDGKFFGLCFCFCFFFRRKSESFLL